MEKIKYGYIVDSAISMSDEELKELNISKVCFGITDSLNNEYEDDNKILTTDVIMSKLKEGIIFKSNAVSPGKVMVCLEDMIDKYENIILFTISSGLSSFYQNVQYLTDEYKGKFHIVDTGEIGYGIRNIVLESKKMLEKENKSLEEVLRYARKQNKLNYTMFTCRSWEPLRKSGRAPAILAKTFDFFKTKPLIRFELKNKLGGIATSFKKQVAKMITTFFNTFKNISLSKIKTIVFYNNNVDEEEAKYIRDEIIKNFNIEKNKIIECFVPNLVLIYTSNQSFGIHIQTEE